MRKENGAAAPRLTVADVIAGGRLLLLPIAVVAVLVAAGHLFHEVPAADGPATGLAAIPQQAWIWALIAYIALILPRRPFSLQVPGLAPLGKAAIAAIAGACFLLQLRFHGQIEPLMGGVLAGLVAVGCALATGLVLKAGRVRQDGEQARDRLLHQLILEYERLNQDGLDPAVSHPALFAEVAGLVRPGSTPGSVLGTSIWFLRPHPALDYRRPIDVLREPGGEARLLQACRIGPNF